MTGRTLLTKGLTLPLASVVVLTCTAESSCGGTVACKPTTTDARDASSVDLSRVGNSSVLTARLTSDGSPVVGRGLIFRLHSKDNSRDVGTVVTGGDGAAQVDLKNQARDMVAAMVAAKSWEAIWTGDSDYCSSSGSAPFHLVHMP
jgi:hypothetical protein